MEGLGILAGVLLLSGGVFGWLRVRKQVRLFSLAIFGTSSLREGLERQADILGETPKSVSGMTKLCLPQIESDFPEFQWAQWRDRIYRRWREEKAAGRRWESPMSCCGRRNFRFRNRKEKASGKLTDR